MSELKPWIERVLAAQSTEDIFAIVEEFRPLTWSDEERATLAKTYNAKVYQLNANYKTAGTESLGKHSKAKESAGISKQNAGNQRGESVALDLEEEIID